MPRQKTTRHSATAFISVSTKTGDTGTSGLANGRRLPKSEAIFEVLGTLDELNSWLGLVIAELGVSFAAEKVLLMEIQDVLFQIGAEIAQAPGVKLDSLAVKKIELHSETLQKALEANWTTQFLYPGGTLTAAHLDLARAVCRRFERVLVQFGQRQTVNPALLKYVNRLSDFLFVVRCLVNERSGYREQKFSYVRRLLKKN